MRAVRHIGVIWLGQSNQQGATLTDNGAKGFKFISRLTGETDPYFPNSNGGGSCLPMLQDLGGEDGIRYWFVNGAVGGASISHFTGSVGATIGGPTIPLLTNNTAGAAMTGGTGVPCREGDPDFDPYGLLNRARVGMARYPHVKEWIGSWANAESDGGTSLANYKRAIISIGDYLLASGCKAYFAGLSASGANSAGNMNRLQAGVIAAITEMRAEGKPVHPGPDLYDKWGMNPPVYTERSQPVRVHLTGDGQEGYARLARAAFRNGGF